MTEPRHLNPASRAALRAIAGHPHYAVYHRFTLRGWARRGGPIVRKAVVEALWRAGLVETTKVNGATATTLTAAGRFYLEEHRPQPSPARLPASDAPAQPDLPLFAK